MDTDGKQLMLFDADDLPMTTPRNYARDAEMVGMNGLDRDRDPFTPEETEIANRIGMPK